MNNSTNFLVILLIINAAFIFCQESSNPANVENLKILRKSVNFSYKAGNEFLNLIRGSSPPVEYVKQSFDLVIDYHKKGEVKLNEIIKISIPVIGYLVLAFVGLLFVIFMPIVGCCFCLCRCIGKCGGRVKGMDPKHARCKRYTYAIFLGIISVIMLAGIVLAFINNQLIHDSLTNPSSEINGKLQIQIGTKILKESLKNISEAIDSAEKTGSYTPDIEIKNADMLSVAFKRYFQVVENKTEKLGIESKLTKITSNLGLLITVLNGVYKPTNNLSDLQNSLTTEISNLRISRIHAEIQKELTQYIGDGYEELKNELNNEKPEANTGKILRNIVRGYNSTIKVLQNDLISADKNVKTEYLEYRMYAAIGICCLLLLIVLFYFLGLCFGQCGERPFEDARICNRGVGANLMMAGVAFAFLFTPAIMLLEINLFLTGGMIQTEVCRYLIDKYPPGAEAIDQLVNELVSKFDKDNERNGYCLDCVLNRCPSMPMAEAFNIKNPTTTEKLKNIVKNICNRTKYGSKEALIGNFFKKVENYLLNLGNEIGNSRKLTEQFDANTQRLIEDRLTAVSTEISRFQLQSIKHQMTMIFDEASTQGLQPALDEEVLGVLNRIYTGNYKSVECTGMSESLQKINDAFCVTILQPINGLICGIGICLVFTIPAIIFAVKLAGLYRRTEKFSADYEEPDYHSYMGFYTNNAENIPLKRPKGKSKYQ